MFSNSSISYSRFLFGTELGNTISYINQDYTEKNYSKYFSGVEDFSANIDFDYFPSPIHLVKFGAGATQHRYSPGVSLTEEDADDRLKDAYAGEYFAYIEDEFSINKALLINIGFRLAIFNVENTNFIRPQPRFSLRYKAFEHVSFKTSYSRMVQHIHLLSSSKLEMPMDLWVPATAEFEPPTSDQLAAGAAINISDGFNITVEAFYKNMDNLIEYKEGVSYAGGGVRWEDLVEKGIGWSYGTEFLFEKTKGKTTGWLAYTWSKTERQIENINFGKPFPYQYDRRHDLSIVVVHQINKHVDLSGTWVFNTGSAATVALTKYPLTGVPTYNNSLNNYFVLNYNGRNAYRLPDYHRLDLGINFRKEKERGTRTWNLSVYNVYSRRNAFMLTWRTNHEDHFIDENGRDISSKKLNVLSLFPIIPSISYSFKF